MKYEIEIPNLPEGVRPLGVGAKEGDLVLLDDAAVRSACDDLSIIKLELLPGYEAVGLGYPVTIRRKPRKRVRMEFDMPEDWKEFYSLRYSDGVNNQWLDNVVTVTVVEGK